MGDHDKKTTAQAPDKGTSSSAKTTGTANKSPALAGQSNADQQQAALGTQTQNNHQQTEDLLDAIAHKYSQLVLMRKEAVENLQDRTQEQDPPPAWQTIAIAVGSVALAAATGGIGAVVAAKVTGAILSSASKLAAQAAEAAVSSATAKALEEGLKGGIKAGTDNSAQGVTRTFFLGQSKALLHASAKAQDTFNIQGKQAIRQSDNPLDTAQALLSALENTRKNTAFQEQFSKSLAAWANFLARGELGTYKGKNNEGTNLGKQLGDTSAKGVLGLEIEARSAFRPVKVIDAEIEGLNENLRTELASRPIGQLGIAVTVHGAVDPPAWYETNKLPTSRIRIGLNESGTTWNRSDPGGNRYLMWKGIGHPVMTGPKGFNPTEKEQSKHQWTGVRNILNNELKPKSLKSLGVTLDG